MSNVASPGVQTEASALAGRLSDHLFGHILPFWSGPALDKEQGGWIGWLSNDLIPDRTKPKGLIVNSRILWTFSSAYLAQPQQSYAELATRAFEYLVNRFWDPVNGGVFWQLDDGGSVIDKSKKIYGQAFFIYAMAEFYKAFGNKMALQIASDVFELVERHARDPIDKGYFEVFQSDWAPAGPDARLSEKDMNEKKSMNNNLHVLEAYTNLYRVFRKPVVAHRLRELIEIFETRVLDGASGHLQHFFDEHWNVKSDSYTFGHDIEASWLLCEAAEELRDEALLARVRKLAIGVASTVLEQGVDTSGGLCYEGRAGRVIDTRKECWPQAEAMVGFINAWQLGGGSKFLGAAERVWGFCEQNLVDKANGEWFWRINEDGKPDAALPKVSEWKGPYHVSRACLEVSRRLTSALPH